VFRGIDLVGAMSVATELHCIQRFPSASALMAFVGLVPREHSSSDQRYRGGITKTGNGHVRRTLIEAAWSHRLRPSVLRALKTTQRSNAPDRVPRCLAASLCAAGGMLALVGIRNPPRAARRALGHCCPLDAPPLRGDSTTPAAVS
jgi:hypothetical protein